MVVVKRTTDPELSRLIYMLMSTCHIPAWNSLCTPELSVHSIPLSPFVQGLYLTTLRRIAPPRTDLYIGLEMFTLES